MLSEIKNKVSELEPFLINIRRHLHQNPELSGQEFKTADYIFNNLIEAGIQAEFVNTEAGPSVIANIITDPSKETIAFRADIDALPLEDKNDKPYCSKNCGVCHACGHDFNMTSILGTALVLAHFKNKLDINIRFIFQPSEESSISGAEALIKKGVMEKVNAIWAVHANPDIPVGKIGIKDKTVKAGVDSFKIRVNGTCGHSARPHLAIDSIFIANKILNCLYTDIARHFEPFHPIVLTVGKIQGGTARNVISAACELEGTLRTFDTEVRRKISELVKEKSENIAKVHNATVDIEWHVGPAPVINDYNLVNLTNESASEIIGIENILRAINPSMGAEDFSRYLDYAPGVLIRIGTGSTEACYPLHSCQFDVDDRALAVSVGLLSMIALNYQQNKSRKSSYINSIN